MQKVYLLLRNNQQNGPLSLNELVQYDLKPHDLIWVEGNSAGWYYPQEIEALRSHLPFLKSSIQSTTPSTQPSWPADAQMFEPQMAPAKKIFVSMPTAMPAYQTKEKIASNAMPLAEEKAPAINQEYQPTYSDANPSYTKSLNAVEKEPIIKTSAIKAANKPMFSKSGFIVLGVLLLLFFVVWRIANKPAADEIITPQHGLGSATLNTSDSITSNASQASLLTTKQITGAAKKLKTIKASNPEKMAVVVATKPVRSAVAKTANNDAKQIDPFGTSPVEIGPVTSTATTKNETVISQPPVERKKKIGEKILDIFRKKKEEPVATETKPAEDEAGGRTATHREANIATQVAVKFDVPNSWMMGIKGAKAVLSNRSNETILKAVVEVSYYNEDNSLLQTKTISFTNVGAKKAATVSIPDQSFADHLEYKILSVQGAGEVVRGF